MPSPFNDDSRVLFKFLVDRQWHDYEEIVEQVARTVPPGRALRKYENSFTLANKGNPDAVSTLDDAEKIRRGSRKAAIAVVSNWKRQNGVVQQRWRNDRKEIRVKPSFVSNQLPGYEEPVTVTEDPASAGEGSPEVPQSDSEPSESEWSRLGPVQGPPPVDAPVVEAEPLETEPPEDALPDPGDTASSYAWPPVALANVPECPECGLAIRNEAKHREWHESRSQEKRASEMALLDESQLRDVVRDVTGQVLDDFQRGMQVWLMQQFTQLTLALQPLRSPQGSWRNSDVHRSQKQ